MGAGWETDAAAPVGAPPGADRPTFVGCSMGGSDRHPPERLSDPVRVHTRSLPGSMSDLFMSFLMVSRARQRAFNAVTAPPTHEPFDFGSRVGGPTCGALPPVPSVCVWGWFLVGICRPDPSRCLPLNHIGYSRWKRLRQACGTAAVTRPRTAKVAT